MKDPENRPDRGSQPDHGGNALKRLREFQEARGLTEENADQFAADYAAGVAHALAMRASAATPDHPTTPDQPTTRDQP